MGAILLGLKNRVKFFPVMPLQGLTCTGIYLLAPMSNGQIGKCILDAD
jgi:hypothetical protein